MRGTHFLETARGRGGESQDTKRMRQNGARSLPGYRGGRGKSGHQKMRMSEGDSLPKDHIERDKLGHENKCDQAEGTHFLETTSGGTSKDT